MTNYEKYINGFKVTFGIEEDKMKGLKYQDIDEWDSVGHMNLVAELEESYDIIFDSKDIIDFSSFEKGIEILKKYEIEM